MASISAAGGSSWNQPRTIWRIGAGVLPAPRRSLIAAAPPLVPSRGSRRVRRRAVPLDAVDLLAGEGRGRTGAGGGLTEEHDPDAGRRATLLDFRDEERNASGREVGKVGNRRLAFRGPQACLHLLLAVGPELEDAVVRRPAAIRSTQHPRLFESVTSRYLRDQGHVGLSVVALEGLRIRRVPVEDCQLQHRRLLSQRPLPAAFPARTGANTVWWYSCQPAYPTSGANYNPMPASVGE